MSSPFSFALTKLDGSLRTIQSQLDCLRAALEVNDDQLSPSLTDARQHAATLRDLIRMERPDANWIEALDQLIHELEVDAKARRNQQLRTKLLDLANELDAGRVKHRFDAHTTALNTLRLEAVKELRMEAALPEQVRDLPGPNASEWLHWACSLQEANDALVVINLRRDFAAVERFAGEMEESYWIPGQRGYEGPTQPSEPSVRPAKEPAAESLASPSPKPVAPIGTDQDQLPQNVSAQFAKAIQSGNCAEALLSCSPRQLSEALFVPETLCRPEATTDWQPPTAAVASDPHTKYCYKCRSSYPGEFEVCPIDNLALRVISEPIPGTTTRDSDLILDQIGEEGRRAPAVGEAPLSSPLPMGTVSSPEPAVPQPAEPPSVDPSRKPHEMEFAAELRATLRQQQSSAADNAPPIVSRKRHVVAWVVAATAAIIVVLGAIFAAHHHFNLTSSSKPVGTVATASANVDGMVQDSEIQKDIEQKLAVLKGSFMQVKVQDGVVTLVARSSSEEDLVKAEALASQASGVKGVRYEVQLEASNPYPPASSAKSPEPNRAAASVSFDRAPPKR